MTSNASAVLEFAALSSAGRASSLLGLPALLLLITEAKCGVFANAWSKKPDTSDRRHQKTPHRQEPLRGFLCMPAGYRCRPRGV